MGHVSRGELAVHSFEVGSSGEFGFGSRVWAGAALVRVLFAPLLP